MKSKVPVAVRYLVAAALIVWLSRSGMVDWHAIRERLRAWELLVLPFSVLAAGVVVTSWRFVELLKGRGLFISLADATRLSLVSNLFNLVLPIGGGDVARFYYASASAVGRRTEVAAIMALDRFTGLVTLLVMPVLAWPLVSDLVAGSVALKSVILASALGTAFLVAALALLAVPHSRIAGSVSGLIDRLPYAHYLRLFVGTIRGYRERPSALVRAAAVSMAAHVLTAIAMAMLYAQGAGGPTLLVGTLAFLGFAANSLPLTPGGVGVGEAAFEALFSAAGLSGGADVMLAWRVLLLGLAPAGMLIHLRGLRVTLTPVAR